MDQTPPTTGTKAPTIRIARVGTFTSNEGVQVSFGAADLAAIAAAYNAETDPAPLVVGHPRLDDPAYGWVADLAVQDDALVAVPRQVEPSFAEMVREGRFPKVSARFYPPAHPANPAPGAWYLKHIGFLGAHAPGIKGLGTVQFADGDDAGALTIDFSELDTGDDMTKVTDADLSAREAALTAREDAIAAREKAAAEGAAQARHAAHVSFAEGLVSRAVLAPAAKGLVVGLLDHFEAEAMVSFGEAGEMAPGDAFRKLLDGAAPLIDLGERGAAPKGEQRYVSFAAPEGYEVDPDRADLHARAVRIQHENPGLDWMACVRRAQQAA